MELFKLLQREIKSPSFSLVAFIVISGLSNAFLLGIINSAAATVSSKELNWQYLILFLLSLGIFFFTKKRLLDSSTMMVETVVNRLRVRLADKIRLTELATLQQYGTATIYARITQDATMISNASTIIISSMQGALLIVFTLFYVATISILSFILIGGGLIAGMLYYMAHNQEFQLMWQNVSKKETLFFERLSHILDGFNEININRRKNEEVFRDYIKINNSLRDLRIKTSKQYNITLIFNQMLFYLLLGVILFVLPRLHTEHAEVVVKVVTSILFIVGPLESLINSVPAMAGANNAAVNITLLEAQLEQVLNGLKAQQVDNNAPEAYQLMPFEKSLDLKAITYQYNGNGWNGNGHGFQVGPVNLTIKKGELIFITGGNGSGKSTFAKLLTGLYKPTGGQIVVDGEGGRSGTTVNLLNYQQYKNLYSIIFSDYHLFDKIYGVNRVIDPEEVSTLLEKMELPPEKTRYKDGAFTNIRLSSGQKKRLALTTVLLEDKPVYFFDEVASDLDPEFRDKFYFEILGDLKAKGKTIFVVSHDQQYWNVADRLIRFMDGQMQELTKDEVKTLVSSIITKHGE